MMKEKSPFGYLKRCKTYWETDNVFYGQVLLYHNIFQENLIKFNSKYFNLYKHQFTILISVLLILQITPEEIW